MLSLGDAGCRRSGPNTSHRRTAMLKRDFATACLMTACGGPFGCSSCCSFKTHTERSTAMLNSFCNCTLADCLGGLPFRMPQKKLQGPDLQDKSGMQHFCCQCSPYCQSSVSRDDDPPPGVVPGCGWPVVCKQNEDSQVWNATLLLPMQSLLSSAVSMDDDSRNVVRSCARPVVCKQNEDSH